MVLVASFAARITTLLTPRIDINFLLHELLYKRCHAIQSAFRIAAFEE